MRTTARTLVVALAALGGMLAVPVSASAGLHAASDTGAEQNDDGEAGDSGEAASDDLVVFGVSPANAERPDNRSFVQFQVAAGATVYEHVALINQSDVAVPLSVYAGDVTLGATGGLVVSARDQANAAVGSWIAVDGPDMVSVPPQSSETGLGFVVVPIAIHIPTDAEPGDHVGAVVASLTSSAAAKPGSPGVDFEQRVAARIYIRVDGDLDPRLEITDISAVFSPEGVLGAGTVTVSYTLRNTGNVRMAVEPAASVAGPFGLLPRSAPAQRVDELLPGSQVEQTVEVPGVWAMVWHQVTVSATATAPTAGQDPGLGTVESSTVLWAVPWLWLGVLLLLIALMVWRFRARRVQRARSAKAPAGSRRARRSGTPDGPDGLPGEAGRASADGAEDRSVIGAP